MPTKPKVYLDSACFIDVVKLGVGASLEGQGRDDEVWFCERLLAAARDGAIEVYSSMIAVAECVAVNRHAAEIPDEVRDRFERLLTSGRGGVILVEATIFVLERARDLRWKNEVRLRAIDGIHVATALEVGCEELLTTDSGILKRYTPAAELGLRLSLPSQTNCLPNEYRQHELVKK